MIANYHTHTPRCNHASGSEEAYIQSALAGEMKILGFADHSPYWFPGDYYSTFRMYPEELAGYADFRIKVTQKAYDGAAQGSKHEMTAQLQKELALWKEIRACL